MESTAWLREFCSRTWPRALPAACWRKGSSNTLVVCGIWFEDRKTAMNLAFNDAQQKVSRG